MNSKKESAPLYFTSNELGTIFMALLTKEDNLKFKIEELDGDSNLFLHTFEERRGIKKSALDKQLDKATFLNRYQEELKSTQALIARISEYWDELDGSYNNRD